MTEAEWENTIEVKIDGYSEFKFEVESSLSLTHPSEHLIRIRTLGGTVHYFSVHKILWIKINQPKQKATPILAPKPAVEGKCRSCKHDMSDGSSIVRTPKCPDHLDGSITDGCDKYQRKG